MTKLADYKPLEWAIDTAHLEFHLHPTDTRVISKLLIRPLTDKRQPLILDAEDLHITQVWIGAYRLDPTQYKLTDKSLIILEPLEGPFVLSTTTLLDPSKNTQLSGLYMSHGIYLTQCEAEGFRRITPFFDRPDMMTKFTVRVWNPATTCPVILANGNHTNSITWEDPHPKPCYLFALVVGDLCCVEDSFTTMSGRKVALKIYTKPGKKLTDPFIKCSYAMGALKRAMKWDEENFGREYDLDTYNIVAVPDFNAGAMENKGLNVFNEKYILADPETATDDDYADIETVIAHEYFHNWTGNRITCRDWFQLCLKEGLTVYRDQEFSADMRGRAVTRIEDVKYLMETQFVEDAGPLAHAVRPSKYNAIDNLYTATVYNKGAEIIRMLRTLVGKDVFKQGMNHYFKHLDGKAITVEDFLHCFELYADYKHFNVEQFMRWYTTVGTPEITAKEEYDAKTKTYKLTLTQSIKGKPINPPLMIPLNYAIIPRFASRTHYDGHNGLLVLENTTQEFVFRDMDFLESAPNKPLISLNRGFTAPVLIKIGETTEDRENHAIYETDPVNRWMATQEVWMQQILAMIKDDSVSARRKSTPLFFGVMDALFAPREDGFVEDPALLAQLMSLPSERDIAHRLHKEKIPVDVARVHKIWSDWYQVIGSRSYHDFSDKLTELAGAPKDVGTRSLHNACLAFIAASDRDGVEEGVKIAYDDAINMTFRLAALSILSELDVPERQEALADFRTRYADDPLMIDEWMSIIAEIPEINTLDRIWAIINEPDFSYANPNRVRALIGSFAHENFTQFNRADGIGYEFVADMVLKIDPINSEVAADIASAFENWKMMKPSLRTKAKAALKRIMKRKKLSSTTSDIIKRCLV